MSKETFFLVIPPGLENLAKIELHRKFDLPHKIVHGGIEIYCSREEGINLNPILKIPNRILWRIDSFKCRDLPKLFKRLQKIPWNSLLASTNISFSISSSNSRLFDSRKIGNSASEALSKYFISQPAPKKIQDKEEQKIFLRFDNDLLTISLDTSGEKLHRRGYRTHIGSAPIRENIAAACLLALSQQLDQKIRLIDPMCGSGTFLIEAQRFHLPNENREYLYPFTKQKESAPLPFNDYFGSDIDSKNIEIAKANADRAKCQKSFEIIDLFGESQTPSNCAVICNPPYGKRIATTHTLEQYCTQILDKFSPQAIAFITPANDSHWDIPSGFELKEKYQFENGGIKVKLLIITKVASSSH